jgi:hypothetical protein
VRRAGALAAAAVATVALFFVSRGKWSEALIDSGREWIVPDALARGDLLYRDVVYWFGPLTPYLHAGVFRVVGSGFGALVFAGVIGALAVLASLAYAVRRVAGPLESGFATGLAIPVLVFMPAAGGAILGMGYRMWHAAGFGLLALAAAASVRSRRAAALASGALAALAGLCRTEWGLMALAAAALVVLRATRSGNAARLPWLLAGFLLTWGAGWAIFVRMAGPDVLLRESPVFLLGLPEATRTHVVPSLAIGWATVGNLVYACSVGAATIFLLRLLSSPRDSRAARSSLVATAAFLAVALVAALAGGLSGPSAYSAAPVVCAAAMVVGWRRGRGPRAALLLGLGAMGLLALHRRPFFIGDGPYVAPPLLFALACAAGLARQALLRRRGGAGRRLLRTSYLLAAAVAIAWAFVDRAVAYASDERVWIRGTERMLSARPEEARAIEDLADEIRGVCPGDGGLVAFPEGEILNELTGWRNPLRHKLYLPGYLSAENEPAILRELEAARPEAVVILSRAAGEYGGGQFGQGYGARVRTWIETRYEARTRNGVGTLFVRRGAAVCGSVSP